MTKLFFTKDHEWLQISEDTATIGITNYAQAQLGDLVFVELPEIGRLITVGDSVLVVESVKAASDVYAPVSGEIISVNDTLSANPGLVNENAEKEGWLWKMRLTKLEETDALLSLESYRGLIE